ncbi:MAG: HlyD family efflux transporter periplasmic adaptor subunit [Candidatus Omnitrophica bacterium]|nr:HlyD family efflux transporter periplasmic adaptor subunit [Candidatus Omnitrophota bacterium]
MRINKFPIFIIVICVIAVGLWLLKSSNNKSKNIENQEITPVIGTIQTIISTTGDILPKNRLEIKPPVNGRVESVTVKEGDQVKTGQVVAWMSSTDRAALLDAARGKDENTLKYWQDVYKPIALVAPIDGEVIVATVQPGQTVTVSDAVIVLSDQLIARAQVDETDIGKISLGQKATVTLDAYPDTKLKAMVEHLYYESTTVNNVTIYNVDLTLKDIPAFCRSGMNATIDFREKFKKDVLLLPIDAVKVQKDSADILVKTGPGKTEKRHIQTGLADTNNIEITSGLTTNDIVIVQNKKFVMPKSSGSNPFMPSRRPAQKK